MSLSVAVLRVENPDIPADCDATVQAGLLVCALERQGHRVQRWRVHFHHLEALYAELAAEGCEVFAIEAAVPLDVLERLCRREPKPALILFGPLASSHLLQTPAPVAVLENTETTVALLQAITIAPSLTTNEPGLALGLGAAAPVERWLPRERLAGIPDLLFRCEEPRMPPVAHTMGTESPFETPRVPSSDTSMNPARPTHTIECSRAHRPWSPEAELTAYAAPLIWNVRGPERDPLAALSFVPLLAGAGCVHSGWVTSSMSDPMSLRPPECPEETWQRLWERAEDDPPCPLGTCPATAEIGAPLVIAQAEHLWNQGARSFALRAPDPFDIAFALLAALIARDRLPEAVRLSPSLRAVRQRESALIRLLEAFPQVRFQISGLEFFFAGRPFGRPSHDTSQWEARGIARLLQRLDDQATNLSALAGHRLRLLDPYVTLEEVLDSLQALEEDAPFLKAALVVDDPFVVATLHSPLVRAWTSDGLLTQDGPFWMGYRSASAEIPVYRDLLARGFAPLLEAVGRLRLPPRERDRLAVEGRFRWFRELARFIVSRRGHDRSPMDGWGQVLAAVTGELGLDRTRPR